MRDITPKFETHRTAEASAVVRTSDDFNALLIASKADKGDALEIARVAGIMAAKKTWETIPFCHPIPITHAGVSYKVTADTIEVRATCTTIAATGCEVEAMTAASIAALTIYDMLKPHSKNVSIADIHLVSKTGGKSDYLRSVDPPAHVSILVTSNAVVAGKKKDKAGRIVRERLDASASAIVDNYDVIGDDFRTIVDHIRGYIDAGAELVLTVGGTGLVHSDVTVEAVMSLMDREVPGIMEAARSYGQKRTPAAMISRGLAAMVGKTLVITMPGSTGGARETMDALFPTVLRVVEGQRRSK